MLFRISLILLFLFVVFISFKAIAEIALHVSHPSIPVIFGSAVLTGWLMGLLSWSVTSSKNAVGQIIVVYMIPLIIGRVGFHHSVVGNIEMFSELVTTTEISLVDYLTFIAITLIGNAGGGVFFVAFLKYRTYIANSSS